jgi:hypothetical protein
MQRTPYMVDNIHQLLLRSRSFPSGLLFGKSRSGIRVLLSVVVLLGLGHGCVGVGPSQRVPAELRERLDRPVSKPELTQEPLLCEALGLLDWVWCMHVQ